MLCEHLIYITLKSPHKVVGLHKYNQWSFLLSQYSPSSSIVVWGIQLWLFRPFGLFALRHFGVFAPTSPPTLALPAFIPWPSDFISILLSASGFLTLSFLALCLAHSALPLQISSSSKAHWDVEALTSPRTVVDCPILAPLWSFQQPVGQSEQSTTRLHR